MEIFGGWGGTPWRELCSTLYTVYLLGEEPDPAGQVLHVHVHVRGTISLYSTCLFNGTFAKTLNVR